MSIKAVIRLFLFMLCFIYFNCFAIAGTVFSGARAIPVSAQTGEAVPTGAGALEGAIAAAEDGTELFLDGVYTLGGAIEIKKNLTLRNHPGKTAEIKLAVGSTDRHFIATGNIELTLEGLTFSGHGGTDRGGSAGVRDISLLESALENIYQTFDDNELYPTKEEKAAWLGYSLISNHAFVDGNKRIGIYVMLTFLEVNGIKINCKNNELVKLGLDVAKGDKKYIELLTWIKEHK